MNYDEPRQREKDGRWHYTTMNDGRVRPIGYCAEPDSPCHEAGHETGEEAIECYGRYLLDRRLRLRDGPADPDDLHRCQAKDCRAWTAGSADFTGMTGPFWWLCDEHRTRETVETLFEPPAASIHS